MARFTLLILLVCRLLNHSIGLLYNNSRLPLSLVPYHYDLTILTHLETVENLRFEGNVKISIRALESTDLVVLHVNHLTVPIDEIELSKVMGKNERIEVLRTERNKPLEYLMLYLKENLTPGNSYTLKTAFKRRFAIKTNISYFVGSHIKKETNETCWYSLTQFERNHIRSALPSFDEPGLRATFKVTLGHHRRYQSFSNMPLLRQLPNHKLKDYVWSIHEVTPPMPTYTLAYSINDFSCTESRASAANPVIFRICTLEENLQHTLYASKEAPKLLEVFEQLFDIPFPLKKIDQLAVKEHVSGMENWGLITYAAENALSEQPKVVDELVSHELAHMWFGNLVTNAWWSDLWIKEGFSNYFSVLAVARLHPDWNYGNSKTWTFKQWAFLREDSVHSVPLSHGVEKSLQESNEIEEEAYNKATSVIRMMHTMLGTDAFYEGLRSYLRQYAYGSTHQDQLWLQLQKASERLSALPQGFEVKAIMQSWTLQKGYPILYASRNERDHSVTVAQLPFSRNSIHGEKWWVPLTYTTEAEQCFNLSRPRHWLKGESSITFKVDSLQNKWLILNLHSTGYYRVNYDEESWRLLNKAMIRDHTIFPEMNRVQFVNDVIYFYKNKLLDVQLVEDLLSYLVFERSLLPWSEYENQLTNFSPEEMHNMQHCHQHLVQSVYNLFGGLTEAIRGLQHQDEIDIAEYIMKEACSKNIGDCVQRAKEHLQKLQNSGSMDKFFQLPTACAIICHGHREEREFLHQWLKSTKIIISCYCSN